MSENKVKNENHITIDGWMINELNLKGSELIIYALIYGFSQDGQSEFFGSRSYIAEWCNSSLPTIDKALNELISKEYIIKRAETINNVTFNRYKVNLGVVKNLYRGSKESLHNNIEDNTYSSNYNNKQEQEMLEIFERNLGRPLAPMELEKIKIWLEEFEQDIIEYALKIAILNNKRNLNYINAILRNWKTQGCKTIDDIVENAKNRIPPKEDKIEIDEELLNYDWFEDNESEEEKRS